MRVVVVGSPAERSRLRSGLQASTTIVGEFETLAEARASGISADAILLPPPSRTLPDAEVTAGETLTAREQQVLELLAEGLPNKAIAARLGISDQTVKFHVASIAAKLGATNRTETVRLALRRGLLTL
jgi:NarL family two-component system response regulator YdfI